MKPKTARHVSKRSAKSQASGLRRIPMEDHSLPEQGYAGIYLAGSISALVIVVIFLVEMLVVVTKGLPPISVEEWFNIYRTSRAIGLIRTFALDIVAVSLHVPLYLALYYILRQTKERFGLLLVAIVFALIGVAVYLGTNTTFSMLSLSDEYSVATTEVHKVQLIGAGKAVLSVFNGTGPFAAYALYSVAGILVSIVMLKGSIFGKATAIIGIVGNALELGLPPSIDPAFFMKVDPFLIGIGGVFIIIWYVLISLKLIKEISTIHTQ
jgi:hypothetical protein